MACWISSIIFRWHMFWRLWYITLLSSFNGYLFKVMMRSRSGFLVWPFQCTYLIIYFGSLWKRRGVVIPLWNMCVCFFCLLKMWGFTRRPWRKSSSTVCNWFISVWKKVEPVFPLEWKTPCSYFYFLCLTTRNQLTLSAHVSLSIWSTGTDRRQQAKYTGNIYVYIK